LREALDALERDREDSLDSGCTQVPKGTMNMVIDLIEGVLSEATPSSGPALDVERLAEMRGLVEDWLDAERLLDTMTIDDGPAHQDAWDAVHFTRERIAAEYARLSASLPPDPEEPRG
jgi:hypothetical protein